MASSNRCLDEVLGLTVNSSPEEIRSAYKKLALQCHPDKLLRSGLTHHQATAQFHEPNFDYSVLSDPQTTRLSDFFYKIHNNEINFVKKVGLGLETVRDAPRMGNLQSPVKAVGEFYNYWRGFSTVMGFRWVKGKMALEREELKGEYNERVRKMAEFVRKRDKRVLDLLGMVNEHRKKIERERKQLEELEMEKKRKEYVCEVCGEKFQREKHEQWRKRVQDLAKFGESFVQEEEVREIYKSEVDFVKKLGLGLDTVQEVPRMGNLQSLVKEVRVSTVVDFWWVEGKTASETEELKEEYNDRVKKIAEFVRKRDNRVIDLLRKVKIEQERRKLEELEMEMEMKKRDYRCELCGEKFQREKREQWRKRMQDVVEFWQSFVEEEG
ncbi:DNAJ protein JJJ1 homolog [Mangifera indica]|uniref:DNAJ protein JJJ1 homolog n=1 Tax=Mangifera indica TaxID=29780 RepID=UPI001CFB7AD3|nr:DNAJ protein JJJ1 homolog [Mangifera indica]